MGFTKLESNLHVLKDLAAINAEFIYLQFYSITYALKCLRPIIIFL